MGVFLAFFSWFFCKVNNFLFVSSKNESVFSDACYRVHLRKNFSKKIRISEKNVNWKFNTDVWKSSFEISKKAEKQHCLHISLFLTIQTSKIIQNKFLSIIIVNSLFIQIRHWIKIPQTARKMASMKTENNNLHKTVKSAPLLQQLENYIIVDVGANLTNKKFSRDLDSVLQRAKDSGSFDNHLQI